MIAVKHHITNNKKKSDRKKINHSITILNLFYCTTVVLLCNIIKHINGFRKKHVFCS